jgi:hypothetical protein
MSRDSRLSRCICAISAGQSWSAIAAPARPSPDHREREIVRALQAKGFAAARVPLSGAVGGRFSGDVVLPLLGRDLCVEVKARADGFCELYSWLAHRDVLIVKADRQPPLVVVRLALASEVAGYSGGARPGLKARGWGTP